MISGGDLYSLLSAMVPLYVTMVLAYASVRWWKILTPDQCCGINRFVSVFAIPLLSFKFIAKNNPYTMNIKFIAADGLSKVLILILLCLWARYTRRGSFDWMITIFMLATLPNTLVMGIPLLKAIYGGDAESLVVQAVVLQCIIWYTLLLFLYEYRTAKTLIMDHFPDTAASIVSFKVDSNVTSLDSRHSVQADSVIGDDRKLHVQVRKSVSSAQGLGLESHHSSRSSNGLLPMPSSKVLTPRPSNLTGAGIYSLHSSVDSTPWESMSGRDGNPRQSNFISSALYSHQSSRGPIPRMSTLNEEYSEDPVDTSPHPRFPPPVYHPSGYAAYGRRQAQGFDGSHRGGVPRGGPYPGERKASPKLEDKAAKKLHMYLWSSSTSSVSESGLHAFGNMQVPVDDVARNDSDKEVRLPVRRQPESNRNYHQGGHEVTRQTYDEYFRDDLSFGSTGGLVDEVEFLDMDGRSLSRSSSTAEPTPKLVGENKTSSMPPHIMMRLILVMVFRKLIRSPSTYSCLLGVIWSLVSFKWHLRMPLLIDNSLSVLSDAGLGMAMFSLGLCMAVQGRLIVCGPSIAVFAVVLRFIIGPAAMAGASIAVGLRGPLLHASIVEAAMPQGIVPLVFAKEYNLHPDVLSTAVILGMLLSLPITLLYYVILGV